MTNFPASSSRSFSSPPIWSAPVASTNPTKIIALQLGGEVYVLLLVNEIKINGDIYNIAVQVSGIHRVN
jgi:hypothetical protein